MIRPTDFSSSIAMQPMISPTVPHAVAARHPVTASVQVTAGHPALSQHAVPPYETFLSTLSFVLAAVVATAELVRMSGSRAAGQRARAAP